MSDKFYGALTALAYCTIVGVIGYGMFQDPLQPTHVAVPAPIVAEAPEGPRCTIAYPRGFKFTKRDKKLASCGKLDVDGVVWGLCSRRIPT